MQKNLSRWVGPKIGLRAWLDLGLCLGWAGAGAGASAPASAGAIVSRGALD